jgi:hypothetical protein
MFTTLSDLQDVWRSTAPTAGGEGVYSGRVMENREGVEEVRTARL